MSGEPDTAGGLRPARHPREEERVEMSEERKPAERGEAGSVPAAEALAGGEPALAPDEQGEAPLQRRAALLIDWENFYLGRERAYRDVGREMDTVGDLEELLQLADRMVASLQARTVVRRAYADFNAVDGSRFGRDKYYLQGTPRGLMESGVEPVQVFRFNEGHRKNAADIRMTVEALRLCSEGRGIDLFVLVTGDADFVPLAIDLRRMGAHVFVVGVRGQTSAMLRQYSDRMEMLSDPVAPDARTDAETPVVGIVPRPRATFQHSPEAYARLLREEFPKIYLVARREWRAIVEHCLAFHTEQEGQTYYLADVHAQVADECGRIGIDHLDRKVKSVLYQMRCAGCYRLANPTLQLGEGEKWKGRVELVEDAQTYEQIDERVLRFVLPELRRRVRIKAGPQVQLDCQIVAELLEGPQASSELAEELSALLP